ncbi:MAG: chromosomal replication initiator protein DnaA [Phycisphaerales bacterium]
MSPGKIRDAVIAHLRKQCPDICRQWFDDIQAISCDHGRLYLQIHEPIRLRYLERVCGEQFNDAAQSVTQMLLTVRFVEDEEAARRDALSIAQNGSQADRAPGRPFSVSGDTLIHPDFNFENFVVGPDNRLAHAAALAVAQSPGSAFNPYFIHGGIGLGKTHLLQAICQYIIKHHPSKRIHYTSCSTFYEQFTAALTANAVDAFREHFLSVDVLLVDDIHLLSQRLNSQDVFFHTFNTLHQTGRQMVMSSDAAPSVVPDLEERLASRFGSGLVFQVDRPCFETRVAILKSKAALRGLPVTDEVASYVAKVIDSNIRPLESVIANLTVLAETAGREPDLAMARQATNAHLSRDGSHAPTIDRIVDIVCDYFNVRRADLLSEDKHQSIVRPRQIGMWLAKRHTRFSFSEIGGHFGGRDHSTVIHARKTVDKLKGRDEGFARDVDHLESLLLQPG